ncbi:DUF3667 domain-containing protein [Mucilaginibacter sp. HD30]
MTTTICKNCQHDLPETFCPNCGEKRFDKHQLTIKHFAEETLEGLIHFDTKFLRTIKTLFTKPGQLASDFVEGRQTRYMKPIAFFIVINLLFFMLMMFNPYSLSLYNYTHYKPFTNYDTERIVAQKIADLKVTEKLYAGVFDTKIKSESKAYIFAFIPIYGIMCSLLFITYKRMFVEHLIFALHFVAFILCVFFLEIYCIMFPLAAFFNGKHQSDIDQLVGILTPILVGIYFFLSVRRFYGSNIWWSLVAAGVIAFTFFDLIQAYRMLLFFKILYL